jgi:shikimate kinase
MAAVLVGFMGAGKTTVGRIIAERLGQPFVDSDVLIEQRLGRSIRDIFNTEGEDYFRELEHATVADLVRGPEAVIALGGGALLIRGPALFCVTPGSSTCASATTRPSHVFGATNSGHC